MPLSAGLVVVGVAHAGCGGFGEDRFIDRPGFGGEGALDVDRAVAFLGADVQAAFSVAFGVVGFGAVLVEQEQHLVGGFLQLGGPDAGGQAHEVGFDLFAGGGVDEAGEVVHGVADLVDVLAVDQSGGLGGRGGRQYRRQRFAGQGAPRPQVGRFGQAAVGVGRGDAPPDPQDVFPGFGAEFLGCGLGLQPGQGAVPLRRQLTRQGFEFVEHGEQFAVGQHVEVAGGQRLVRGAQRGHRYLNRSRQHDSNIHSTTDKSDVDCDC